MQINASNCIAFIGILAEVYGKEIPKTRAQAYADILADCLHGLPFNPTIKKLSGNFDYFPTPAQIIKFINPTPTNKEKAFGLVQTFIDYLGGRIEAEAMAKDDLLYCKARFRADRFGYQSGTINLAFDRRTWLEIAERDFDSIEKNFVSIQSPKIKTLVQGMTKGVDIETKKTD